MELMKRMNMNREKLNTILLAACLALLVVIAIGVYTRPTLAEIDYRIMAAGRYFRAQASQTIPTSPDTTFTLCPAVGSCDIFNGARSHHGQSTRCEFPTIARFLLRETLPFCETLV